MRRENRSCPICSELGTEEFHRGADRPYLICPRCDLVFVPAEFHLTPDEERRRYELHENSPSDHGYRRFLSKLVDPLISRLQPGSHGIDFGAGPGPALSSILREKGFHMTEYDPFFACDPEALDRTYDFVACTEAAEHFSRPAGEFELMMKLVRPRGIVGVMTQMRREACDFSAWNYIRDETHICFYSSATFEWIASRFGARLELIGGSIAIIERP